MPSTTASLRDCACAAVTAAAPGAAASQAATVRRFSFIGVGSPRQEILARALAARGRARGTALCVGASLLFLSGEERRAPRALQGVGLEWAWRLAQDPRRLARRYLVEDPVIIALLLRERSARLAAGGG